MEPLTLKPNRTVAVTLERIISISISLVFGAGLILAGGSIPEEALFLGWVMIAVGALILLSIPWILWSTKVRYEKTSYRIERTRIVTTSGGPFSDSGTELELRNVTHVKLVLPWIENKLFGTGAVHVESAGTGGVEAHLIHLDDAERVYTAVQTLMRENGFRLTSTKELMNTRASSTGAVIDVLTGIATAFFALIWVAGVVIIPAIIASAWLLLLMLPVLGGVAFGFYAYYRNSVSKTYTITEDAIIYDEGFLTRRKAIIPVENLSNSHINEPLLKRIFGVSDVLVSCQGSSSEIAFRNLPDAKRFDASIGTLIDSERTTDTPEPNTDEHRGEVRAAARKRSERKRRTGTVGTTTYKPSIRPALVGSACIAGLAIVLAIASFVLVAALGSYAAVPLLIASLVLPIIVAIGFLILQFITVAITTYTIEPNRVKSEVSFLNRVEHAFNDDRMTRITIRRTFFDRLVKTVSIEFWSIGSGDRITFGSVDEASGVIDALEHKYGLHEPDEGRMRSEPHTGTVLRAYSYGVIAGLIVLTIGAVVSVFWAPALIAAPIVVLITGISVLFARLSYRDAYFAIDERTLYETHGWFTRTQSFVNVEDIKGVTTTQYPFGREVRSRSTSQAKASSKRIRESISSRTLSPFPTCLTSSHAATR
jgi:uncharacterized membrane protein YdbT with pleckstrin-like domain